MKSKLMATREAQSGFYGVSRNEVGPNLNARAGGDESLEDGDGAALK